LTGRHSWTTKNKHLKQLEPRFVQAGCMNGWVFKLF